jgi:hypothetical protein
MFSARDFFVRRTSASEIDASQIQITGSLGANSAAFDELERRKTSMSAK